MAPDVQRHLSVVLALLVGSGAAWGAGLAGPPQQDIVAVEARVSLSDSEVSGLADGAAVVDQLRGIQQILSAGVAGAARQELQAAIAQIDALSRDGFDGLPASYRVAGELWLPVRADRVQVRLDAPDVLPRPPRRGQPASDNLIAEARRIEWLPLDGTRTLLDAALRQLDGSQDGGIRAGEFLAAALANVRQTTQYADPAALDAYYAVEAALEAGDTWEPDVREGLRRAAERLSAWDGDDKLGGQLRTAADALTPETEPLLSVARALRARIKARADSPTGQGAAPTAPGADSEDTLDVGAIPARGGRP